MAGIAEGEDHHLQTCVAKNKPARWRYQPLEQRVRLRNRAP